MITLLSVPSRKELRCLDALVSLIAAGTEFPDAVWRASANGQAIDAARLGDLYDDYCMSETKGTL